MYTSWKKHLCTTETTIQIIISCFDLLPSTSEWYYILLSLEDLNFHRPCNDCEMKAQWLKRAHRFILSVSAPNRGCLLGLLLALNIINLLTLKIGTSIGKLRYQIRDILIILFSVHLKWMKRRATEHMCTVEYKILFALYLLSEMEKKTKTG